MGENVGSVWGGADISCQTHGSHSEREKCSLRHSGPSFFPEIEASLVFMWKWTLNVWQCFILSWQTEVEMLKAVLDTNLAAVSGQNSAARAFLWSCYMSWGWMEPCSWGWRSPAWSCLISAHMGKCSVFLQSAQQWLTAEPAPRLLSRLCSQPGCIGYLAAIVS